MTTRVPTLERAALAGSARPFSGDFRVPRAVSSVLAVTLLAMVVESLLWAFLYFRPTPFGRPFALDPAHYVFHAAFYGAWAHAMFALPFLGWAMFGRKSATAFTLQVALTTFLLVLGAVDREVQRFMGMHASLPWLETYGAVDKTPDVIWLALAGDRGGAWSSVMGLGLALSFPIVVLTFARTLRFRWLTRRGSYALGFLLVILPTTLWNFIPGGTLRQAKVRPALLLVMREATRKEHPPLDAGKVSDAIAVYQAHQRARDVRGQWEFTDAAHPLRKHHVGPALPAPAKRPNFIVLQLETFRAKDMKSMNEGLEGPAPTPFLDSLAASPNSAAFQRYYASGVPTVFAFMSIHTSLLAHPTKSIPFEATHLNIEGFPELLGEAGYHTMHFTGSDPDWDSQRVWLDRWYDEVHFDPSHRERDRDVFRAASARIREQAKNDQPFLAYVVSISNHAPFRTPEPALSIPGGDTAFDALHDTMRYTDDVVREFYASIQHEPWFDDTILIVTGDHGYDLGDRGEAGGHQNLRHETTWVPLIVHGKDARLPRGKTQCVGSHVDLAPTLMELASVWRDNSFMGHSLLACDEETADAIVLRGGHYSYESRAHSLYRPTDADPFVYEGHDLVQAHGIATPAGLLPRADRLARAYETSLVYAIDDDRVAPRARPEPVLSASADLP